MPGLNAAMVMDGPAQPSPSIEDALSGFDLIEVRCNKCSRMERVPLARTRRKKETPLHMLEASFGCENHKPLQAEGAHHWSGDEQAAGRTTPDVAAAREHVGMKFIEDRPYAKANAAARRLLEIAGTIEAALDGRIYVECVNIVFLREGGRLEEYYAGIEHLKVDGMIEMHPSGAYFRFTDKAHSSSTD